MDMARELEPVSTEDCRGPFKDLPYPVVLKIYKIYMHLLKIDSLQDFDFATFGVN
jgi:hypothetical protein